MARRLRRSLRCAVKGVDPGRRASAARLGPPRHHRLFGAVTHARYMVVPLGMTRGVGGVARHSQVDVTILCHVMYVRDNDDRMTGPSSLSLVTALAGDVFLTDNSVPTSLSHFQTPGRRVHAVVAEGTCHCANGRH